MAEDAKPEPGWYWITTPHNPGFPMRYIPGHGWILAGTIKKELPLGCTLGPSIAELLRDAERYRWLRDRPIAPFECEYPGNWRFLSAEERNETVDAEIARDRHPGGGG